MFSKIPVVYAVGTDYQIFFAVRRSAYAWIKIGDRVFDDTVCGNMRSMPGMRHITVPQAVLDAAGGYTLCLQRIRERKSYWTQTLDTQETRYRFFPVPASGAARCYMVGDAHGDADRTLAAAKAYGDFDFLIVNGDMNESVNTSRFELAHNVAAELCRGERPVVYARGNHENRGAATELLPQYIPLRNGRTYYTFRLGGLWGIVLDCGEDKEDDHPEYGGYARFHAYRQEETAYLRRVLRQKAHEFDAPGVTRRIVVVHTQFPRRQDPEFDTERSLYQTWCDLLEKMRVDVMLTAHMHSYQVLRPGDPDLRLQISCPLVIGTANNRNQIGGTGCTFGPDGVTIQFTTSDGTVFPPETL
ncbi:MAG: metallophosphoesterase [Clostridia bacterium]|nr:metallophosphoesterase [Clostridia bacterium]